jgi:hypothetical protein
MTAPRSQDERTRIPGMSTWPNPDRTSPAQVSDERESLDAWVDYHRARLLMKCVGARARAARQPHLSALDSVAPRPRSTSDGGRRVIHDFDGEPVGNWYSSDEDPDACFNDADPSRAMEDLAAYHTSIERARAAVESRGLDELSPEPDDGRPVSFALDLPARDRGVRAPQRSRGLAQRAYRRDGWRVMGRAADRSTPGARWSTDFSSTCRGIRHVPRSAQTRRSTLP